MFKVGDKVRRVFCGTFGVVIFIYPDNLYPLDVLWDDSFGGTIKTMSYKLNGSIREVPYLRLITPLEEALL